MDEKTIMVIDDEPDILRVVSIRLRKLGYRVLTAVNGIQGLETIRREIPDLVLLDLVMPLMNGAEVCERLRSDKELKHIPIVLFTAGGSAAIADEKTQKLGADDYIIKPFEPDELAGTIEKVLAQGANL